MQTSCAALQSDPSIQSAKIQNELITMLQKFVHMIASHTTIDLQGVPEVGWNLTSLKRHLSINSISSAL